MQRVVTYAEKIGLAFQIVDDLLDQTGDEAKLGKRVGVDDTHEKNTFLRFYSVEEAKYFADQLTQEAIKAARHIGPELVSGFFHVSAILRFMFIRSRHKLAFASDTFGKMMIGQLNKFFIV